MRWMCPSLIVLAVCQFVPLTTAVGQENTAEETADDSWAAVEDRTPLFRTEEEQGRAELFAELEDQSAEVLREAAEEFRERRLDVFSGSPADFSPYADMLRYPKTYRGRPIHVRGRVERDSPGEGAIVLTVSGASGRQAIVLLPENAAPPEPGQMLKLTGLFFKLVSSEADEPSRPGIIASEFEPLAVPPPSQVGVEPGLWANVRHRTLGIAPAERDLYYLLVERAGQADAENFQDAARMYLQQRRAADPRYKGTTEAEAPFRRFVDIFSNPEAYEGRAVELIGHVRKAISYPADTNEFGIETLYELWMYTDDSQQNPAVIVTSDLPEGFPMGDDLQRPVRIVGYFFKLYGYQARDTARIAPLIIAGPVVPLAEPADDAPTFWLSAGLIFIVTVAVVSVFLAQRSDRQARAKLRQTRQTDDSPQLDLPESE
ncbi:hypothetical protein Pan189_08530 [Stratiformator vulcanicus]|uniref:Uncharacterized protein n=2 Tax=Stratiformator vulcanicus TaxID=2527980 RepID=A0A517QXW5_9PLAN|nr:hypothetical protein Pan189_08530 [Stratiformator vulcanicus]